jgi:hypothetical protein
MFVEFPKWIRRPGKREVLVENADAEAAQFAAWDAEDPQPVVATPNPLLPQLDHDQNGAPGGSLKGAGDDLPALRIAYKAKFGKRAFPGWNAAELRERLGVGT